MLRSELQASSSPGRRRPTYNDMVVQGLARSRCASIPRANGSYRDGRLQLHSRVNVGVAVAAEDALVVPTVFDAEEKSLGEIARETRALAERVRAGTITPPELGGGTFTVSNLGMYGVTSFTAIINPPQAAILSVGALAAAGGRARRRARGPPHDDHHARLRPPHPLRRRRGPVPGARPRAARGPGALTLVSRTGGEPGLLELRSARLSRADEHVAEPIPETSSGCAAWGRSPTATASRSRSASASSARPARLPDTLLLLEHPPVYTRGRRSRDDELAARRGLLPRAGHRGGRRPTAAGGSPTTGPASWSAIRSCASPTSAPTCARWKSAIIAALAGEGISARSRCAEGPDYTGVWVEDRKIASIGVHVSRGVTTHGFAVNVDNDLEPVLLGRRLRAARTSYDLGRRRSSRRRTPWSADRFRAAHRRALLPRARAGAKLVAPTRLGSPRLAASPVSPPSRAPRTALARMSATRSRVEPRRAWTC